MKKPAMHRPAVLDYASPTPCRPGFWSTRAALILISTAIVIAVIIAYCGVFAIDVLPGLALDGACVALWFAAAGVLGAATLRLMRIEARGAMRFVTSISLGLGIWSLAALGLGLAGWLNRWTTLAMPLASAALLIVTKRSSPLAAIRMWRSRAEDWLRRPAHWAWLWLAAMPCLGLTVSAASIMPGLLWKPLPDASFIAADPHPYDVMIYHLQVPREWFEAGRITPLPHNVYSFFPFNMEMQYLLAMHMRGSPWGAMYLCQFLSLGCMVLSIIAIYAATVAATGDCQEATKRRSDEATKGIVAATMAASVPWLAMLGSVAYIESGMILFSVLAIAWAIHAIVSDKSRCRHMLLCGVFAGFACGTKYTGVTVLAMVPVATLLALWLKKVTSTFSPCAAAVLAGILVFSPWLVRNLAWSGNPVFPMAGKLLGQAHFDDVQLNRWNTAHRAPPSQSPLPARLTALRDKVFAHWQFGFIVIPLGIAAMIWRIRRPIIFFLALLLVGQLLFWVFFTHLQPRFAILAIPIAAIAAALVFAGRYSWIGASLALLCAITGFITLDNCFRTYLPTPMFRVVSTDNFGLPQLAGAEEGKVKAALIGDGQAFFYQVPMRNFAYRTIFDIRFDPDRSPIDSWLGEDLATLRNQCDAVIINPAELRRLSRTYAGVPTLPRDWLDDVIRIYRLKPPFPEDWADPGRPVVLPPAP